MRKHKIAVIVLTYFVPLFIFTDSLLIRHKAPPWMTGAAWVLMIVYGTATLVSEVRRLRAHRSG